METEKSINKLFHKLVRKKETSNINLPLSRSLKTSFLIYIFFLLHMAAFGLVGFLITYKIEDFAFALIHGGIAITVYIVFYLVIFGKDSVLWLFINSIIGIAQIKAIINLIGNLLISNWDFENYPSYFHIIPGIYVVLYTFLLRRFLIDLFNAKVKINNQKYANSAFIIINIVFYLFYIF